MFINYNATQNTFTANTFRNNGDACGNDREIIECINAGADATASVEIAQTLVDAHYAGDYSLDSETLESLEDAIEDSK